MDQFSFTDVEYWLKRRKTRLERFFIDALIPWQKLNDRIRLYYHNRSQESHKGRCPAYPPEVMLYIHMVQLFYNLSDPAMEDTLYEINSIRCLVDHNRLERSMPDEASIMVFVTCWKKHNLGQHLFVQIKAELTGKDLYLTAGSIVDTTIIKSPGSTRNKVKVRNPEIVSTCKGNRWYLGMKIHIGADRGTDLIHALHIIYTNEHDLNVANRLLHGEEKHIYANAGYLGMNKRGEWFERFKACMRAKVKYPFDIVEHQFG